MASAALEANELGYERRKVEKPTWERHIFDKLQNPATELQDYHNGEWSTKQLVSLGQGIYPMSNPHIQSEST